jgi:hypothetical protein
MFGKGILIRMCSADQLLWPNQPLPLWLRRGRQYGFHPLESAIHSPAGASLRTALRSLGLMTI